MKTDKHTREAFLHLAKGILQEGTLQLTTFWQYVRDMAEDFQEMEAALAQYADEENWYNDFDLSTEVKYAWMRTDESGKKVEEHGYDLARSVLEEPEEG